MIASDANVLLIGAGGLGSPAALVLAKSGIKRMTIVDDDVVDASNLHRQLLFDESDVGADKVERAASRLLREGVEVQGISGRFLPANALELARAHTLVIEGADNFATKFLACDACAIARVPLVSAGAVRWNGWALASVPSESPCLRCVFEDLPRDRVETCAEAGVVGPVVGVLGAICAALALRILGGETSAAGELWSYRALQGSLRSSRVNRRRGCSACEGAFTDLSEERYAPAQCSF